MNGASSPPGGDVNRRVLWAAMLMCAIGVASFSLMDAVMKGLSLALGAYSALLWRSIVASSAMSVVMAATRNRWPPADVLRLHILRGMMIAPMGVLFFWSLTVLPLAEAIALSFIAPVIALYLSAITLREKIGRNPVIAAAMGMIGVAVILTGKFRGEYDANALAGALAVLVSAVLFAFNLVLQRQQAQKANMVEISFFQNVVVLSLLLPFAPWALSGLPGIYWPMVFASAALAIVAQMLLSRAYARTPASRLIPLEYSAFGWAALLGWLMFDEKLTWTVIVGVVLIVIACLVAAREEPELVAHMEGEAA